MWRLVDEEKITFFGTSATYINLLKAQNYRPKDLFDLCSLKSIGQTGSPLSAEGFEYAYAAIKEDVHFNSLAGGTDINGCFCMGTPILPVYAGQLQGPALGMKVKAYDEKGNPVYDEQGELVCEAPAPSMPIAFLNDPDFTRYRDAYFTVYPGIWRHGDYVTFYSDTKGVTFFGRSDAILKPSGVRIGTAEIYNIVDKFDRSGRQPRHRAELGGRPEGSPFREALARRGTYGRIEDEDQEQPQGQGFAPARAGTHHRSSRYPLHLQLEEGRECGDEHRERPAGDEQGRPGESGFPHEFREHEGDHGVDLRDVGVLWTVQPAGVGRVRGRAKGGRGPCVGEGRSHERNRDLRRPAPVVALRRTSVRLRSTILAGHPQLTIPLMRPSTAQPRRPRISRSHPSIEAPALLGFARQC